MSLEAFMAQLERVVRARRKELRLSQEEVAARAPGLDQAAISKIEAGLQGLRTETLFSLAGALKVPPYALLGGAEPPQSAKAQPLHAGIAQAAQKNQRRDLTDNLLSVIKKLTDEQGPDEAARLLIGAANSLLGEREKPKKRRRRQRTTKTAAQRRTTKQEA
jgi:transcriptional regulator with XRE-family HTH domain